MNFAIGLLSLIAALDLTTRGDHAMGFSHEKTTHHFLLYADGGAIQVTANDPHDSESRDQIRMHMGHITQMFAAGDFQIPMLVHAEVPPGVAAMKELKSEIMYKFEKLDQGGRVVSGRKGSRLSRRFTNFCDIRFRITKLAIR